MDFALDCIKNLTQIENFSSDNNLLQIVCNQGRHKGGWDLVGYCTLLNVNQCLFMRELPIKMMMYLYSSPGFWKRYISCSPCQFWTKLVVMSTIQEQRRLTCTSDSWFRFRLHKRFCFRSHENFPSDRMKSLIFASNFT